jgi:hypothetical protein
MPEYWYLDYLDIVVIGVSGRRTHVVEILHCRYLLWVGGQLPLAGRGGIGAQDEVACKAGVATIK